MNTGSEFDTICAIATPIGEGGIGIIRISGPEALPIAKRLFRSSRGASPAFDSHRLYHGWIHDPQTSEPVDEVLLGFMASPRTYTREDVVEINCHGGYTVLNRILALVLRSGARLAHPGEFTRRAFLNGRIDLSQAEAVIDTIRSRSRRSLAAAGRHLAGEMRRQVELWREVLLQIEAQIGANLDFPDEMEDSEPDLSELEHRIRENIVAPMARLADNYEQGRVLREGLSIVLAGKPNVGKSSLMNALLERDRAIVTPAPGTTRDVIEDSFLLSGVLVTIFDTAGIRSGAGLIESLGIDRTLRSLEEADLVLWLIDGSLPLGPEDDMVFDSIRTLRHVILANKADLPAAVPVDAIAVRYGADTPVMSLSALNRDDIEELRGFLYNELIKEPVEKAGSALVPNARQKECLDQSLAALARALELTASGHSLELVGIELNTARLFMDSLLGMEAGEDILDRVFSSFCIGK